MMTISAKSSNRSRHSKISDRSSNAPTARGSRPANRPVPSPPGTRDAFTGRGPRAVKRLSNLMSLRDGPGIPTCKPPRAFPPGNTRRFHRSGPPDRHHSLFSSSACGPRIPTCKQPHAFPPGDARPSSQAGVAGPHDQLSRNNDPYKRQAFRVPTVEPQIARHRDPPRQSPLCPNATSRRTSHGSFWLVDWEPIPAVGTLSLDELTATSAHRNDQQRRGNVDKQDCARPQ